MVIRIALLLLLALTSALADEKDYTPFVKDIQAAMLDPAQDFRHSTYNRLAYISDTYGPRMWGSETLEMVIGKVV